MSKSSLLLCAVYTVYLILGAVVFMFLEYEETETVEVTDLPEWAVLKGKSNGVCVCKYYYSSRLQRD